MALRYAFTLQEARQMLALWKDCEYKLASGQAKSYRIGTREFTSVDGEYIAKRIEYYSNAVKNLSTRTSDTRSRLFVPRDM